jgi:hypothetical protein
MADITVVQEFDVGPVTAVDRKGRPASFDGAPVFTSDNESVVVVVPSADGDPNKATIRAVGIPGGAQVKVSVDADIGEGIETLEGFVGVNVLPEKATALNVPVGEVRDQA